jgi:hypothetical protein
MRAQVQSCWGKEKPAPTPSLKFSLLPAQTCHPTAEVSMTPLLVYAIALGGGFFVFAIVGLLAFIITDEH